MYSVLYISTIRGDDMDREIGFYLKKIFQTMDKSLNKELETIDLTSMQAHVLIYLYKNKNNIINQRDIERKFELNNPTVNGILNRLENKGFIRRVVSHIDARNKEISLTDKSVLLINDMKKSAKKMESKMTSGIQKEELDVFYKVIKKMFDNVQGGI